MGIQCNRVVNIDVNTNVTLRTFNLDIKMLPETERISSFLKSIIYMYVYIHIHICIYFKHLGSDQSHVIFNCHSFLIFLNL